MALLTSRYWASLMNVEGVTAILLNTGLSLWLV